MERLTFKLGNSYGLEDKASSKVGLFTDYDGFYAYLVSTNRLGAYEDTGLTPEEIEQLKDELKHAYEKSNTAVKWYYELKQSYEQLQKENAELKEKLEQDKACGYCKTDNEFKTNIIVFENDDEKIEVQFCFGMLEIIHKRNEEVIYHVQSEINYCPMCGRKLVE